MSSRRLSRPAVEVAPHLLGALLHASSPEGEVVVRLTEVEAYGGAGQDAASHAYNGPTPRTSVMFGPPGHFYVYFTYGTHWCANVVTGVEGEASALLLRAGEVVSGVDVARSRRPAARTDRDLARGPARLTMALGVTGAHNGLRIDAPELFLEWPRRQVTGIVTGPRVGITRAIEYPWRFWIDNDPTVSVFRPGRTKSSSG